MSAAPAMAQGIGPSSGPFRSGPPQQNDRRWFLDADIKGGFAPSESIVGLNQYNVSNAEPDFLGARYYIEGRATAGATFDTPVIKGAFAFFELTSTHGENFRSGDQSWGLAQVAWVRRNGVGVLLPRNWMAYVSSHGRWAFPDRDAVDGPFEIYNFIWVGKSFEVRQQDPRGWFLTGYMEGGFTFSHNEIAFNIRRPDQPETEYFGDNYARYAIRGTVQVGRAVRLRSLRQISAYVNPFFAFGRNIPQQEYTWEARYIGARRSFGLELLFVDDWRAFAEWQLDWGFGDEDGVPGTGPFEEYFVLGVSKAFLLRF